MRISWSSLSILTEVARNSTPSTGLMSRLRHSSIHATAQEVLLISVRARVVMPRREAPSARASGERVPYLKE